VPFDDVADRGNQRADIPAIAPMPPRGSNTCFSSSASKPTSPPRRNTALIIESLKRSFAKPFGLDSRRFVIRPAILALNCGKT
jgi:hypothetical protein